MKLFAAMLFCVFVGLSLGLSISWQRHRLELLEVRVIRVVKTRDESSMRFAEIPVPYTIVEYRPPIRQWPIPGIVGDVGQTRFELPPKP